MSKSILVMLLAGSLAALPIIGCGGQQSTSEQPTEVAEQAPPPLPPAEETASEIPAPPPPAPETKSRPRRATTIPEERSARQVAPAPAPPSTITLTIPAGTQLALGFPAELTSETAAAGDSVVATLKEPITVGDRIAFPAGSEVRGTITDVKSASKGFKDTGGALSLQFTSIVGPDGRKSAIAAGFTKVAEGSAAKKGGIIGGSAVGGALLGKALGKSTGGGAAIGAAIGTAVAGSTKGREARIKPEDQIQVALEQDARVTLKR
jgi:hypothetical protein